MIEPPEATIAAPLPYCADTCTLAVCCALPNDDVGTAVVHSPIPLLADGRLHAATMSADPLPYVRRSATESCVREMCDSPAASRSWYAT